MKLLSVLLGTLTCAFMWHCRGESGWGSSWGALQRGTHDDLADLSVLRQKKRYEI